MDQTATTDDYQTGALFGNAPNPSTITAQDVNPAASGPNDWTTILTNGFASAAVNGINGAVNNAIVKGQIENANAQTALLPPIQSISLTSLLVIGAIIYMVVK